MSYIITALGNPGEEYENTRHNTGRVVLEQFRRLRKFPEWEKNGKLKALQSSGKVGKEKVLLLEPETFMNKSGSSLASLVTSEKKAASLVVIHDDLDLPIGKVKISFNRGPGGHRGVESIIKAIKTEKFIRIRVGISPATPKGVVKKPHGEKAIEDFILGAFKPKEEDVLKKVAKTVSEALEMIIEEGYEKAMGEINSK